MITITNCQWRGAHKTGNNLNFFDKKQLYFSDKNQKAQKLIDDTERHDEEIDESEDYDEMIVQHVDLFNRIVMYKRTPATSATARLATGPAITTMELPKLELPTFCGD